MASESVPPPSTSSATPPMIALSNPGRCCCSRICRLRKIGRPASWRVESWRVKLTSCLRGTPPIENGSFLVGPVEVSAFFATFFLAAFSRTLVGK